MVVKDSAFFALSPLSVRFFFFLMSVGDVVGCWFHNKIVNSASGYLYVLGVNLFIC